MDGFRSAVMARSGGSFSGFGWGGHSGSSPTPFDNVDGARLAGPDGSHPLAAISIEELLKPRSSGLDGAIEIKHPVRIGEAIAGHLRVTATRDIGARAAMLRLVGAAIAEQRRSRDERDKDGRVVRSEEWVEVHGRLFEELPFSGTTLPQQMTTGQTFETAFTIPAPRLGPPTGHYGTALIGWAVEA